MSAPGCVIDDNVMRIAVNITLELEKLGVNRVFAKNTAVEWLKQRCNIPLIIAFEVHNCLMDQHTACPKGRVVPEGTNIKLLLNDMGRMCEVHPSLCNKWDNPPSKRR